MSLKKPILVILSLSTLITTFSSTAEGNHRWKLLEGYCTNPSDFKELEIGKKIVYWHQRTLGEAIVELNYIVFHFDRETQELIDVKMHWREDLPAFLTELRITKEKAESMVEGRVDFSQLYIISPESFIFSPIKPTPENPCWMVVSSGQAGGLLLTVIDAEEGTILGYGIPPPYSAFSLTGPSNENPCRDPWTLMYENAQYWFDKMGYFTEAVEFPTEDKVKSHIQSKSTAMFYELAHSADSDHFASGCDGGFYEITWADEIEDWISGYTKMPFAFIGGCFGMCEVSDDTLSYEFRKGSTEDTATVGYCRMSEEPCFSSCWPYAVLWQTTLFWCMNNGDTVKEAFDAANGIYSDCFDNDCMRFAGDENFTVWPPVCRLYDPISHWKFDETSGTTAEDSIGDHNGTLTNMDPETDWVTGKIDGALDFDGDNDYVSLPSIATLAGDLVTISAWIKADNLTEVYYPIVSTYYNDGLDYGYLLYVKKNPSSEYKPRFYIATEIGVWVESDVSIDTSGWFHIAGTYDGSKLRVYVNGEPETENASGKTGYYENYDTTYIGRDVPTSSYFDGKIDDVRLYECALDIFKIWDAMSGDLPRFRVKDSSGETVAWFDSFGNLFLEGSKHIGVEWVEPSGANDEFIFEDSNGPIVYINESGDLYLKDGDVIEATPVGSGSGDLRIQNSSSADVAIFNAANGNVYLDGKLYENP